MRLIDADALDNVKFHPLPYTHITPSDVNAEAYKRGWNDAIDAIMCEAPTIEPEQRTGEWIDRSEGGRILNPWWESHKCDQCGYFGSGAWNYCPYCGSHNGSEL